MGVDVIGRGRISEKNTYYHIQNITAMNPQNSEAAQSLLERAQITYDWKCEVDKKYGLDEIDRENPPELPKSISGPEDVTYIESYFKTMYLLQKKSIRQFSTIVTTALRSPAEQDALIEKLGGNMTIKDVYFDGCNELNDIAKEYKILMKETKKLRK